MFKRNKKKTGCETPEFRKPTTPSPPPTSGSNVVKPNPNYVPPASVKQPCPCETLCGYCIKWDKKCDKKIGSGNDKSQRGLRAEGNVYDDDCPIPEGVIRKIIKEVIDFEKSFNQIKEVIKETNQ